MSTVRGVNRRQFLITSSLGASALSLGIKRGAKASTAYTREKRYDNPLNAINVGMIAVGARAHQLIETMKGIPGIEITAVCDAYKGRIERALERTNGRARVYDSHREIVADKSIDAVVISTPDHLHREQIIDALTAGKHIYAEKPLTYTVEEGVEIVRAARRNKVAFQVGSSSCSSVLALKAREMIAAGKLGEVTMVRAYYNRNTASGAWIYPIPPDASPQTVNWQMFLGTAPRREFSLERFFRWRCYKDYSGGIATDLFVHLCTTIHYIMGVEMCNSAVGMSGLYRWKGSRDVADTVNGSLEYPEGFMVSISTTFNNEAGGGGIQFLGTDGSLELAGDQLIFTPENVNESNGWIVQSWPSQLEKAYYDDPKIRVEERPFSRDPGVVSGTETYYAQGPDATMLHLMEFFEGVRNGTPTKEDAAVGHHAAACAHMINLSAESKRTICWDRDKDTVKM